MSIRLCVRSSSAPPSPTWPFGTGALPPRTLCGLPRISSDKRIASAEPLPRSLKPLRLNKRGSSADTQSKMARILTVEDDEAIRELIKYALDQYGYDVTEAPNGQAAIDLLGDGVPYDLVILDLMLGGKISGWDVFEEVQKRGLRDQTKVIIMTARSQEAEILKGWRVGVDQYCTKPFDLDMFVVTVQDVLLSTKQQLDRQREAELRKTELLHLLDTVFED
jgi:CheY-like chemotaxis protein